MSVPPELLDESVSCQVKAARCSSTKEQCEGRKVGGWINEVAECCMAEYPQNFVQHMS